LGEGGQAPGENNQKYKMGGNIQLSNRKLQEKKRKEKVWESVQRRGGLKRIGGARVKKNKTTKKRTSWSCDAQRTGSGSTQNFFYLLLSFLVKATLNW